MRKKLKLWMVSGTLIVSCCLVRAETKVLIPVVVSVSGKVEIFQNESNTGMSVSTGAEIPVASEIRTEQNGEVSLGVSKGLALTVKNDSTVRILEAIEEKNEDGVITRSGMIEVPEGRVVILLPETESSAFDLRIKTPQGIIKPRGTFYALMVKDGRSFLAVSEGKVGLEQFVPITEADVDKEKVPTALPQRSYGSATTTSPRG